jgi:hypothetical protein
MAEDLRTLIAIQGWVLKCRRLAAETRDDPETARLLHQLADKIEQRARELDTEKLRPQSMGRPMKKPPLG